MGGNIQKGKTQSSDNQECSKLFNIKESDLKQKAKLGKVRWFFTRNYLNWELYNGLPPEKKKKIFWTIFPLEISHEIERYYINNFPYQNSNKMIYFDRYEKKHVYLIKENNNLNHYGIVKKKESNNSFIIKNENNFSNSNK